MSSSDVDDVDDEGVDDVCDVRDGLCGLLKVVERFVGGCSGERVSIMYIYIERILRE